MVCREPLSPGFSPTSKQPKFLFVQHNNHSVKIMQNSPRDMGGILQVSFNRKKQEIKMSQLQKAFALYNDQGIETVVDIENSINFLLVSIGENLESLMMIGLSQDEIKESVAEVFKLKVEERNG